MKELQEQNLPVQFLRTTNCMSYSDRERVSMVISIMKTLSQWGWSVKYETSNRIQKIWNLCRRIRVNEFMMKMWSNQTDEIAKKSRYTICQLRWTTEVFAKSPDYRSVLVGRILTCYPICHLMLVSIVRFTSPRRTLEEDGNLLLPSNTLSSSNMLFGHLHYKLQ